MRYWRVACEQPHRVHACDGTIVRKELSQSSRRKIRRHMDPSTAAGRRRLYRHLARRSPRPGSGTSLAVMRARTWTYPVPDLRPLLSVPYAITGGVATRLYMQERDADDLDVVVRPADGEQALADLRRAAAVPLRRHPSGGSRLRLSDGSILDVLMIAAPWIEDALARPRHAPDGQPVVDLSYLIIMKLSSCWGHDIGDLARLVGDLDDEALAPIRDAVARHVPDAIDDLEWLIERGRLEYVAPGEG